MKFSVFLPNSIFVEWAGYSCLSYHCLAVDAAAADDDGGTSAVLASAAFVVLVFIVRRLLRIVFGHWIGDRMASGCESKKILPDNWTDPLFSIYETDRVNEIEANIASKWHSKCQHILIPHIGRGIESFRSYLMLNNTRAGYGQKAEHQNNAIEICKCLFRQSAFLLSIAAYVTLTKIWQRWIEHRMIALDLLRYSFKWAGFLWVFSGNWKICDIIFPALPSIGTRPHFGSTF